MRPKSEGIRLAIALAVVLLAMGCSRVLDTDSVESEIKEQLERQLSGVSVEVDCPEDVDAKQGETFDCVATSEEGQKATIAVTQTDDDGSIDFRVEELVDDE